MSTLVPTLCWVPKGVSKEKPDKVELSPSEVQQLLNDADEQLKKLGLDGTEEGVEEEVLEGEMGAVKEVVKKEEEEEEEGGEEEGVDIEDIYDLAHYDSDGEEEGQKVSGAGMGNNLAGLTYYPSNDSDPYITLKNMPAEEDEEDDFRIFPSDNLLVIGRAEEDFSSVEVHVYNEDDDHSHSHHEILLTAFPLALEWLDYDPEQPDQKGNYLAIGSMTPVVEVWDLDTVDALEPVFCLGDPHVISGIANLTEKGEEENATASKGKTKKKKKKKSSGSKSEATPSVEGHTHSVLGLSWNGLVRKVLATASADCTVRVWDMAWPKSILTLRHPDKVQCCLWHPFSPELLATGAYDGVVRVFNCKASESAVRTWKLDGEVERVLWDHFKPEHLLACSDQKTVSCFNKEDGSSVFQIHAHDSSVTGLTLSCYMPGLLVTASVDDTIKFWDIHDDKPTFLFSRDMHMGAVMCAHFCADSPYSLAVGGKKNGFHVINVANMLPVMQRFKNRDLMMPVRDSPSTANTEVPNGGSTAVKKENEKEAEEEEEEEAMEMDGGSSSGRQDPEGVSSDFVRTKVAKVSSKKKKTSSKHKKKHHH